MSLGTRIAPSAAKLRCLRSGLSPSCRKDPSYNKKKSSRTTAGKPVKRKNHRLTPIIELSYGARSARLL
ncbi:hypothetical protein POX_d05823 [Penicillium oxalicum]|uniref:Uncharacterized protein n=1 Tax=Penicillium oxalicum (strain 114-2 / CGMCC 5302) TaxID=933388 RepID=S7ZTB7_PENO1|nr:hypothetical protein POX_d05823 [Penicillium oxalicum]EPS32001.1 hypothetical protein PDE_06960 [Penicillium oxalicum 114-2]KAI2790313.1 hypothetical protein POX_d05823 [Penicillium oxalicum]